MIQTDYTYLTIKTKTFKFLYWKTKYNSQLHKQINYKHSLVVPGLGTLYVAWERCPWPGNVVRGLGTLSVIWER